MANLIGMPEKADMSKYYYLRGNLPMTMLALGSVYMVSAFAEEVIYRGFLITRISELGGYGKSAFRFAVVFSSLVFGLVHSDWGLAGMVQASCMGLALGTSQSLGDHSRPRLYGHDTGSTNVFFDLIVADCATADPP